MFPLCRPSKRLKISLYAARRTTMGSIKLFPWAVAILILGHQMQKIQVREFLIRQYWCSEFCLHIGRYDDTLWARQHGAATIICSKTFIIYALHNCLCNCSSGQRIKDWRFSLTCHTLQQVLNSQPWLFSPPVCSPSSHHKPQVINPALYLHHVLPSAHTLQNLTTWPIVLNSIWWAHTKFCC